jgi:hypothetical protein
MISLNNNLQVEMTSSITSSEESNKDKEEEVNELKI